MTDKKLACLHRVACLALLVYTAAGSAAPEMYVGKRLALVIGNSNYAKSPLLRPLKHPGQDADAVAAALKKVGFDVIKVLHDAPRSEFVAALHRFEERLLQQHGGVALVYYTGHGMAGMDGKNYLLPTDATVDYLEDVAEQGYPVENLMDEVSWSKPQLGIFIVDACRNGVLLPSKQGKGPTAATQGEIAQPPEGSVVFFATAPGMQAWDGEDADPYGPFANALLESLNQPKPLHELFKQVRKQVYERTQKAQVPEARDFLMGEDFYFALPVAASTVPMPRQQAERLPISNPSVQTFPSETFMHKAEELYAQGRLQEAAAYYQQAADAGHPLAKATLAVMAAFRIGDVHLDEATMRRMAAEALADVQRLAAAGDPKAMTVLGIFYQAGLGVAQDDREAVAWFRKAAEQGYSAAQNNLGTMYENGRGVAQDDQEAVAWYRKAAEQGYADAQNDLGTMYTNGLGVAQDDREAVAWYRKAAEQGNAFAQFNLGVMYDKGHGVAQDDREAVAWYLKAAKQGYAAAQYKLGLMYAFGRGVGQDDREAVAWYLKAAEQGHALAKQALTPLNK